MIKFYYSGAPNPMKVALMLEETGLPYEPVPVDTRKGEQHKPEFLAINPNAKVPAIVDGDVTVFDSNAILLYLAEKTGKFLPAEHAEAARRTAVVADVRRFRRRAVRRAIGAFPPIRAGKDPLRHQPLHVRGAASFRPARRASRQAALHGRRQLQHRRHGGVGLGAAHSERAGRGSLGQIPEPEAAGGRDLRPAGGGTGQRAQGQAQVQDRVRRRSAQCHVPASGQ